MFKIVHKQVLALQVKRIDVSAPLLSQKAQPGQFVMIQPMAGLEPIPLSIIETDERKGTITLIVHEVGEGTRALGDLGIGRDLASIVGPLGRPCTIERFGVVICVATGIGAAQILPVCRALKKKGNRVIGIIGAKSKNELMLEAQMRVVCDEIFITTNDGSYERKGLATQVLDDLLDKFKAKAVYAIGSIDMMHSAARMAQARYIPIFVTLKAHMIDGMGLCGSCRVRVGGEIKMICTDGPQFDGAKVDFSSLMKVDAVNKENPWGNQTSQSSPKSDGLPAFMKSFLALGKKKT